MITSSLRTHFGHAQFRPGQQRIIEAVIGGRDVLAVMPTGSGKSLCYQLPAVTLPGITIVVSPLISLMKDQIDELNRRSIPAGALHSMLDDDTKQEAMAAARRSALRLLYVAPERFASSAFMQLLDEIAISRFIVDEAHCVSQWGHDFRPDYGRLAAGARRCRRADGVEGRPPAPSPRPRRRKCETTSPRCSDLIVHNCSSAVSIVRISTCVFIASTVMRRMCGCRP